MCHINHKEKIDNKKNTINKDHFRTIGNNFNTTYNCPVTFDLTAVSWWWGWWLILGFVGWPVANKIFKGWESGGYLFGKVFGISIITTIVWVLGLLKLVPFVQPAAWIVTVATGFVLWKLLTVKKINWKVVLAEELIFSGCLLVWSWVKAHEPTINGLEKFMDYGFVNSMLNGSYFPPKDMWFAGESVNYYYFGHLILAVITRLSGINLAYTFNIMLATIFAFAFSLAFITARYLLREFSRSTKWAGAFLSAFLLSLAGNLQTIYAFTRGYSGETPPPFWKIFSDFSNPVSFLAGWHSYWYPNATRFIPLTIHEFPSYSFAVSDIHGHVLSIPLALTALALIINMFWRKKVVFWWEYAIYGLVCGWLFMTNALDGPIYLGLFGACLLMKHFREIKNHKKDLLKGILVAGGVFILAVFPFLVNFKSFVSGIGVNCFPLRMETGQKIGLFLFENKCQSSPLWMLLILWGFFLYCAVKLFLNNENWVFKVWSVFCLGLIIFPDFFYFKDIYPAHFRSNTMFKLGYQAFMMMSVVSGYVITKAVIDIKKNRLFLLGLIPLLFLVSIYPYFSVNSYFGGLKNYQGLYGLSWFEGRYPGDWAAVNWLRENVSLGQQPTILEANGDSYTDFNRISVFSGLPTVAGWTVHEWLWRGGYEPISNRGEEVRKIYETPNSPEVFEILKKYQVKFIIVGEGEREKYPRLDEMLIADLGKKVFSQMGTTIYQVNP